MNLFRSMEMSLSSGEEEGEADVRGCFCFAFSGSPTHERSTPFIESTIFMSGAEGGG